MNLRDYIKAHADELALTILIAVVTASIVGFRKQTTGAALFMSGVSSATMAALCYPIAEGLGYSWPAVVAGVGLGCGSLSFAFFTLLMKLSDRLEARGDQLADKVIDRVAGQVERK